MLKFQFHFKLIACKKIKAIRTSRFVKYFHWFLFKLINLGWILFVLDMKRFSLLVKNQFILTASLNWTRNVLKNIFKFLRVFNLNKSWSVIPSWTSAGSNGHQWHLTMWKAREKVSSSESYACDFHRLITITIAVSLKPEKSANTLLTIRRAVVSRRKDESVNRSRAWIKIGDREHRRRTMSSHKRFLDVLRASDGVCFYQSASDCRADHNA